MKSFLVAGLISTLAVGSFVAGRSAVTHRPGPAAEAASTTSEPVITVESVITAAPPVTAELAAGKDRAAPAGPAHAQGAATPDVRPKDSPIELAPLEETAEATVARRAETDARLTKELGKITEEQRRFLVDLNDRAIEFQRRLGGEFQRGTISHEDYMQTVHAEMLGQLDELYALVSDDQYRILTGLEPGADPFEFMVSGIGGARVANPRVGGAL